MKSKPYVDKLEKESGVVISHVKKSSADAAKAIEEKIQHVKESEEYKKAMVKYEEVRREADVHLREAKRKKKEVQEKIDQKVYILNKQADIAFAHKIADTPLHREFKVGPEL